MCILSKICYHLLWADLNPEEQRKLSLRVKNRILKVQNTTRIEIKTKQD